MPKYGIGWLHTKTAFGHDRLALLIDHLSIYRQCQQAEREGSEFSESTVGDMIDGVHHLIRPLMAALQRYVFAACKLHADNTPIDELAPGNGKTKQGRLWVDTRDDRPEGDKAAAIWPENHARGPCNLVMVRLVPY